MDAYVVLACIISCYIGFMIGKNKEFCKTKMPFKEICFAVNNYDVNEEKINVSDDSGDDSDNIKDI